MKFINKFLIVLIVLFIIIFGTVFLAFEGKNKLEENKKNLMIDLTNKSLEEIKDYALKNKLVLNIKEEYGTEDNKILSQSIDVNSEILENDVLTIYVSKKIDGNKYKINELGKVPVMMYHGIHNKESKYVGGNIDKDGYQRTAEAFRKDLEFYYNSGYRMIKLKDYIEGIVDVEIGKSPIVLTFDDGLENNIKVTGIDKDGKIIIDPNSAIGILESFKTKYPDFNVTATFFVNGGIFNQPEYNEKILNWLVDNGYDIGNHSYSHADFTKISYEKAVYEIGSMYNILDKYIPNKYINVVAMPFGSPYKKTHPNFKAIIKGKYNDKEYNTISTLQVGWEGNFSPFSKNFDKQFIKRIRAYDNNGKDFDIEMNFKILEKNKYISDGNKDIITIPKEDEQYLNKETSKKINIY